MEHPLYKFQGEREILKNADGTPSKFVARASYESKLIAITRGTPGNSFEITTSNPIVNISDAGKPEAFHLYENEYLPMGREQGINGMLDVMFFGARSYISVKNNMLGGRQYEMVEPELARTAINKKIDKTFLLGLDMPTMWDDINPKVAMREDNSVYGVAVGTDDSVNGLYDAVNEIAMADFTPIILTSSAASLNVSALAQTAVPGIFNLGTANAQVVEMPTLGLRAAANGGTKTQVAPFIVFAKELLFSAYFNGFRSDFTPASFDPKEVLTDNVNGKSETGLSGWTNGKDAFRVFTFADGGYFQPEGLQTAFTNLKAKDVKPPVKPDPDKTKTGK